MSNLSKINGEIIDLTPEENWITPDYTYPYMPKTESIEFFSWMNITFGSMSNKTPKMHYMLVDEMLSEHDKVNALIHREGAKTTVLVMLMSLYFATKGKIPNFGRISNLMIFSGTYDQTVDIIKGIQHLWENSEVLQASLKLSRNKFGKIIAYTERYICFDVPNVFDEKTKRGKKVKKQRRLHISARSVLASMRGTQKDNERINCAMFDDILLDATITSKKERTKTLNWYSGVFTPAVDTKGCKQIGVGTPMVEDDLLMRWTNGTIFHSIKFKIMMEFTTNIKKIISSWKDLHSPIRIMEKYESYVESGTEHIFFRELMLEVVNERTRMFKKAKLRTYKQNRSFNHKKLNIFTSMDLASSKEEFGDQSCVMTIGVDKADNWFLLTIKIKQMDSIEAVKELFKQVREFGTIMFKAEKAALQQVLNPFIEKKQEEEKTYFQMDELKNNSKISKSNRIMGLVPKINLGKFYTPEDRDEEDVGILLSQLLGYTMEGKTTADDDGLDCLANFTEDDFVFAPSSDESWDGE